MTRPLGGGPMPARPLSAVSHSLSRPIPKDAEVLPGSRAASNASRDALLPPPDKVVAPTKPRVLGGAFGRGTREAGYKQADPFLSGGGKSVTAYPWATQQAVGKEAFNQSRRVPMPAKVPRNPQPELRDNRGGAGFPGAPPGARPATTADFFLDTSNQSTLR